MTAQPAPAPADGFPPRLEDVPIEARVGERFGWLAGAAAIACAVYSVYWGNMLRGGYDLQSLGVEAGCVVGAVFFAWYEVWRRLKRTVLVARGPSLGVYRKGALALVIGRGQVAPYELHVMNTIRYLWVPVLFGPIVLFVGLASLTGKADTEGLVMVLAGAYVTAIAASIIWTRIVCKHFFIPKGGGREEVLFRTSDVARLFGHGG
jgi:hypothetical protein